MMAKSKRLSPRNPLSYMGVTPTTPFDFVIEYRAPTTEDFFNFEVGDIWLNASTDIYPAWVAPTKRDIYMLVKKEGRTATWVNMGAGALLTLTGNTGGVIGPDTAQNINVLGALGFTVAGTPATHTLEVRATQGGLLESLTGDNVLRVYPDAAADIDLLGTVGFVTTTGNPGAHTITLDMDGAIANQYVTDAGNVYAVSKVVNVLGSSVMFTEANPALGNNLYIGLSNGTDGQLIIGGGTNPAWATVTVSGQVTKVEGVNSLQLDVVDLPAMIGFSAGTEYAFPNITGDGTQYHCIPEYVFFNNGGIYNNVTGNFTAPRNGYYWLGGQIFFKPNFGGTGGKTCTIELVVDGFAIQGRNLPTHARVPGFCGPNLNITYRIDHLVYMTTGQQAYLRLTSAGGAKTDGIQVPAPGQKDTLLFYGYLYFNA